MARSSSAKKTSLVRMIRSRRVLSVGDGRPVVSRRLPGPKGEPESRDLAAVHGGAENIQDSDDTGLCGGPLGDQRRASVGYRASLTCSSSRRYIRRRRACSSRLSFSGVSLRCYPGEHVARFRTS